MAESPQPTTARSTNGRLRNRRRSGRPSGISAGCGRRPVAGASRTVPATCDRARISFLTPGSTSPTTFCVPLVLDPRSSSATNAATAERWSCDELRAEVAAFAAALRRARDSSPATALPAISPISPRRSSRRSAAATVGAVWSSCSPDFGVQGVRRSIRTDRAARADCCGRLLLRRQDGSTARTTRRDRSTCPASSGPWWCRIADTAPHRGGRRDIAWDEFVSPYRGAPLQFEPLPFNHPLYILYSSGTTGVPKCIVHGAGGTLIQHLKEHQLHCDITPRRPRLLLHDDGWMMWNWLVIGARVGRDDPSLRRVSLSS